MSTIITLAERRRRKAEAIVAALPAVDAALSAYARDKGGRFVRFGSTATGRVRPESDVDLIADFPDDRVGIAACNAADAICFALGLVPDSRPACWVSERVMARAVSEGVVLR